MKIIYIAGLGHSGSTILDLSLGCLKNVVGLGEIKTILDHKNRQKHLASKCSCGLPGNKCELWVNINQELNKQFEILPKYEAILEVLQKKYGNDVVLVDASKNSYNYLEELSKNHDIKLIYLTRDIRSWSYSRHLNTKKPIIYYVLRWYAENRKLQYRFKKMGLSYFKVGYEELSLYPELVLQKITNYAGLSYHSDMLTPARSNSHIISGNIARVDDQKKTNWFYDARWLLSSRLQWLSPLILLLMRMNGKLVYSNIKEDKMDKFHLFGTKRRNEITEQNN